MEYCLLKLLSRAQTIRALQRQGVLAFVTATGAVLRADRCGKLPWLAACGAKLLAALVRACAAATSMPTECVGLWCSGQVLFAEQSPPAGQLRC